MLTWVHPLDDRPRRRPLIQDVHAPPGAAEVTEPATTNQSATGTPDVRVTKGQGELDAVRLGAGRRAQGAVTQDLRVAVVAT